MLQFKLAFRSYSNVLVFFNVFHDVKEKKILFSFVFENFTINQN